MLSVNYASCKFPKPCKKISHSCYFVCETLILGEILSSNFLFHGNWKSIKFSNGNGPAIWMGTSPLPRSWGARWHLTTISSLSWVCLSLNVMIQPSRLYSCLLNLFCKWHDFTRISSILLCFCLFFTDSTTLLASQKSSKLLNIKALSEQRKSLAFSFC